MTDAAQAIASAETPPTDPATTCGTTPGTAHSIAPAIADIADECRKQAGDDIARAADIMIERIRHDEPLYRMLHDPLTRSACYDWLSKSYQPAGQINSPLPVLSAAEQAARSEARAEATRKSLIGLKSRGGGFLRTMR